MELWLFVLIALALSSVIVFVTNNGNSKAEKNHQENRLLLKQLLEGFGLEIPPELKNPERAVIKTIDQR